MVKEEENNQDPNNNQGGGEDVIKWEDDVDTSTDGGGGEENTTQDDDAGEDDQTGQSQENQGSDQSGEGGESEEKSGEGGEEGQQDQGEGGEPSGESESGEDDIKEGLSALGEEVGMNFESPDQLKEALQEYKQLKDQQEDPLKDLPEELRQAAQYAKEGGDVNQFFQLQGMDVDNMDEKQALFESYKLNNPELAKNDPELLQEEFEREYNQKYSEPKQPEDSELSYDEWKQENQKDIDYVQRKRKYDAEQAKNTLSNHKTQKLEEGKQQSNNNQQQEQGLTEEEIQQFHQNAKAVMDDMNGLEVPIGEEGETLNLDLDQNERQAVEQYAYDPNSFIENELGIYTDENGRPQVDYEKFLPAVAWLQSANKVGSKVKQHAIDNYNKDIITNSAENPGTPGNGNDNENPDYSNEVEWGA